MLRRPISRTWSNVWLGGVCSAATAASRAGTPARPAKEITLRDVVELLEGVDINRCNLSLGDVCMAEKRCTMQRRLRELEVGYLKVLEGVSVSDLAKEVVVPKMPKTAQESQGRWAVVLTARPGEIANVCPNVVYFNGVRWHSARPGCAGNPLPFTDRGGHSPAAAAGGEAFVSSRSTSFAPVSR